MARAYTVATAALAIQVSPKWIDNVLSHFALPGVGQGTQGVARRIPVSAVFELTLIRSLSQLLKIPVGAAISGAHSLALSGELAVGENLSLRLDRERELNNLEARLESAVESVPIPKRGRPPIKAKRDA